MSNPQQPQPAGGISSADGPGGPVPPDNQPGHHPATEQDRPDLNAFAEKLGAVEPAERNDSPGERKVSLPAPGGRSAPAGVAVGIAAVVALVLAVVAGRRRRRRPRS